MHIFILKKTREEKEIKFYKSNLILLQSIFETKLSNFLSFFFSLAFTERIEIRVVR